MIHKANYNRRRIQARTMSTSILLVVVLGCSSKTRPTAGVSLATDGNDRTDNRSSEVDRRVLTRGPHEGHLFRLGNGEYYAELTHDSETQTVVVYLLGKTAQESISCEDAEIVLHLLADRSALTVRLVAAPQDHDPPGQSSRFYAMDAELSEALDHSQIVGRISLTIRGTPYGNAIAHERHSD